MANASYNQILSAPVVTRVISTIKTPQSRLQSFMGCGPGGQNVNAVGGRIAAWDIFDKTRTQAKGRSPGTGPATVQTQVIGHVTATIFRVHEKAMLLDERLFRTRPLGANWGQIDARGQRYVTSQERHLAQRLRNTREFVLSRALRGAVGILQQGDDWLPVDIGAGTYNTPIITINFQNPYYVNAVTSTSQGASSGGSATAPNCYTTKVANAVPSLDQLRAMPVQLSGDSTTAFPFGGMSQNSAATGYTLAWTSALLTHGSVYADPIQDCLAINSGFEAIHGRPLRHVWCNSSMIGRLMNSTTLKAAAGTANIVWDRFERTSYKGPDGMQDTGFEITFKGLPWLTFHAYDGGLTNYVMGAETGVLTLQYTKFFEDDYALFMCDPDPDWFEMLEGSEIVRENRMSPGDERYGIQSWTENTTQPAGFELISLDNFIPAPYVPGCYAYVNVGKAHTA